MTTNSRRRIVRHPERKSITGLTNATWYRQPVASAPAWSERWLQQIEDGCVPAAIDLGPNQVGWFDDELYHLNDVRGQRRRIA